MSYRMRVPPAVHVLEPTLDPGHRTALPHVYAGDKLCLYSRGDWDPSMRIAETIIPWTSEWLYHYELWRATDRWHGGGNAHPDADGESALLTKKTASL